MSRWIRIVPLVAIVSVLAACGEHSAGNPMGPASPRMDGGGLGVGGNFVPTDSTQSSSSSNETDPATESGGLGVGGN